MAGWVDVAENNIEEKKIGDRDTGAMGFILTYWNSNMQLMLYFNFRIMDTKEIVKTKEVQSKSLEKLGAGSQGITTLNVRDKQQNRILIRSVKWSTNKPRTWRKEEKALRKGWGDGSVHEILELYSSELVQIARHGGM